MHRSKRSQLDVIQSARQPARKTRRHLELSGFADRQLDFCRMLDRKVRWMPATCLTYLHEHTRYLQRSEQLLSCQDVKKPIVRAAQSCVAALPRLMNKRADSAEIL